MKRLETIDNKLVAIAIGKENGKYYVQTTDIHDDTVCLSEHIQEGLECKEYAVAIANLYVNKYDFTLIDWTNDLMKYSNDYLKFVEKYSIENSYNFMVGFLVAEGYSFEKAEEITGELEDTFCER